MRTTLLFLLFAFVMEMPAFSCSCGPTPSVPEAFEEAAAVFAGRCISAKLVTEHFKDGDLERCQFTFEVTRAWKGAADKKQITVETGVGSGDCGYQFTIGASYILYCNEGDGRLWTNMCTRTCITDYERRVETEMKALDEAKAKAKSK